MMATDVDYPRIVRHPERVLTISKIMKVLREDMINELIGYASQFRPNNILVSDSLSFSSEEIVHLFGLFFR